MKYSKLKHDLELLDLNHNHDLKLLEMKQKNERAELLNSCNHIYEDGSSASSFRGNQYDNYRACDICGKNL